MTKRITIKNDIKPKRWFEIKLFKIEKVNKYMIWLKNKCETNLKNYTDVYVVHITDFWRIIIMKL